MRAVPLLLLLVPACASVRPVGSPAPPREEARGPTEGPVSSGEIASPEVPPPPTGTAPGQVASPGSLEGAAAAAEAAAGRGDVEAALAAWDAYFHAQGVGEHERAFARARADELAARLSPEAAVAASRGSPAPLVRAAAGPRAAAALRARGETDGAARLEREATSLRESLGWESAVPWVGPGDPRRIGLAVPLSGPSAVVGEVVLRGAMMALGEATPPPGVPLFELALRDSAGEGEKQVLALQQLAREEAAIAIVGAGEAAGMAEAGQHGVAFLALRDQAPGASTTAFQVFHGAEARAVELARRAFTLGARTFAILGPDGAAGRRLADAFAEAVKAGGGRLVARATYAAGANVFTAPVAQLRRASFDAVFVPEDAARLELIAPALAAADLTPQPARALAAPGATGRGVLLLSTARGLSKQLLRNAGRYVQGALLAPGFHPDPNDPRAGAFVDRFRGLFGQDPSATDAYSYDAVRLSLSAIERGARTRADLLRELQAGRIEGVTGVFQFGPDHGRVDPPPVYVVEGDEIRALR